MQYLSVPETPAPAAVRRPRGLPRWLLLTAAIVVVGGAAIAMLIILGFNLGPRGLSVGLAAAVLPVPVLVFCYLWLDRYEPEPAVYLIFAFLWGAFPATLAAYGVNTLFADVIGVQDNLVGVLIAPCIEETMKALGPLMILWFRRRQISGITDGLVYCGLSGVGFAMVENILYLGGHAFNAGYEQYGPASGTALVFGLFIARIFMSGFAHPLFTSMTGIGIGLAARSANPIARLILPIPGLILAMMLHGSWNLMAILSASRSPYIFLYGYIALMVPVFITMVGVALWVRASEGRLALKVLPPYAAAGWFTPPEVAALGTLSRRHAARAWAKRVGGDPGRQAMKDFQFAATRLALVRDSAQRGLDSADHTRDEEQSLLTAMLDARYFFAGRDPQMPQAHWDGQSYEMIFPDRVRRRVMAPPEPVVPLPIPLSPVAAQH